jgi:hypothetical protein
VALQLKRRGRGERPGEASPPADAKSE